MTELLGWWELEAPLSLEEYEADKKLLEQIKIPDGVTVHRLEVYLNGRAYEWKTVAVGSF